MRRLEPHDAFYVPLRLGEAGRSGVLPLHLSSIGHMDERFNPTTREGQEEEQQREWE
jgi:hypothetical protein